MNKPSYKETSDKISTSRVQTLCDAIFAIAMTLLILNLDPPSVSPNGGSFELYEKLKIMWPSFYNFGLSFLILAVFWNVHHKQFKNIRKSNEALIWINIIMLLFVVLVPFSTELIVEYPNIKVAEFFFNLNFLILGLIYLWQWVYASQNYRLIDKRIPPKYVEYITIKSTVIPLVAIVAMIISLFTASWGTTAYIVIPFILIYMEHVTKHKMVGNIEIKEA